MVFQKPQELQVLVSKPVHAHFIEESSETHQSATLACQSPFSGHPDPQTHTYSSVSEKSHLFPAPLPFEIGGCRKCPRCLFSWPSDRAGRKVVSGKVARSQHTVEGGAFSRTGWKAPRYNLSWVREVTWEDMFALPKGWARTTSTASPTLVSQTKAQLRAPLPVTQPPWEWLGPEATIKPAPFSQGLVTS